MAWHWLLGTVHYWAWLDVYPSCKWQKPHGPLSICIQHISWEKNTPMWTLGFVSRAHGAIPVAQKHIPELCTGLQCQDLQRSRVLPLMVVGSLGKIWENRITTVYHWVLSCSQHHWRATGGITAQLQVRLHQNVGPAGARSVGLRLLRKWARGREVSSSHGGL